MTAQSLLRETSQRLKEATQLVRECGQLRTSFPSLAGVKPQGSSLTLIFLDLPSQTEFAVTLRLRTFLAAMLSAESCRLHMSCT